MNARIDLVPREFEDLLVEWSRYYKDRRSLTKCGSIEKLYNRNMPGARDSGWGDPGAPEPTVAPVVVPRAIRTNEAIVGLGSDSMGRLYKWCITYHYCFPGLDRSRILRSLKKFSGRRLTWKQYGEALDIARMRVWTLLNSV